jgi:hypothetical protein
VGRQPNRRNFLTVSSLLVTPFASHLEAPRSQRLPVPSLWHGRAGADRDVAEGPLWVALPVRRAQTNGRYLRIPAIIPASFSRGSNPRSSDDRANDWALTPGLTVARAGAKPDPSRYEGSRLNREARISFQLAKSVIPAASPMMQDLGCPPYVSVLPRHMSELLELLLWRGVSP